MAEFLIKAIDANHADPEIDLAGCYRRGDIVLAKPDGWSWGQCEGPPKFVILKVPGISVEEAEQYTKPHTELEPKTIEVTKKQYEKEPLCAEFVEESGVLSEWIEQETMTLAKQDYNEKFAKEYFDKAPQIKEYTNEEQVDLIELTGIITKVKLRGNVKVVKIRTAYKVSIEDLVFDRDGFSEIQDMSTCLICKSFKTNQTVK